MFFLKSGPFLNAGCIMYNISIFFNFTFYLLGGGVRIQRTPPVPMGLCGRNWTTAQNHACDEVAEGPQRTVHRSYFLATKRTLNGGGSRISPSWNWRGSQLGRVSPAAADDDDGDKGASMWNLWRINVMNTKRCWGASVWPRHSRRPKPNASTLTHTLASL